MTPSSIATTSSAASTPLAPASIVCTNRSWPGTSTKPRRIGIGVTEIDGDAAPLLLSQTVGVDAGQRLHQRRLAVIDVTGGADDHGRRDSSRLANTLDRKFARSRLD